MSILFCVSDKDDEDDVHKAIVESTAFGTVMPLLDAAQTHPVITAKACQLIAELAKAGQRCSCFISALRMGGGGGVQK